MSPTCTPDKLFRYNTIYLYLRMVLFKNLTIMKNRLLSMLALATVCLLAGNSANAQVITHYQPKQNVETPSSVKVKPKLSIDESKYIIKKNGETTTYIPKGKLQRTRASENVEVICQFEYDENLYTPGGVSIYNNEISIDEYYDYENNFIKFTIPKGTYDFHANFWRTEEGPTFSNIIKELVCIENDTTIVFNPAEANKHIQVSGVNLQGEKWRCPTVKFSDDYTSYEILDEGNTDDISFTQYIILKDYGAVNTFTGNMGSNEYVSEDSIVSRDRIADFLINDVSDRYLLCASLLMSSKGTTYFVKLMQEGVSNELLTNTADEYILYEENFKPTPLGKNINHCPGFSSSDLFNEVQIGGWNGTLANYKLNENETVKIYINTQKDMTSNNRFNIMVYPQLSDYEEEITFVLDDDYSETITNYYNCIGLPVFISNEGIEYINKGHDIYGNYAFQIPEKDGDILEYPGHPAFSYTDSQKTGIYGNSSPINAFMAQNSLNEYLNWKISYLSPCYIGRLGEIRMSDYKTLKMSLKYNGNEVLNNYNQLDSLMTAWAEEKQPYGEIDLTLTNENVDVDGISGYNLTRIIYDQRKEDWTAPTLQMLHFKNTNGMITDRFEVPQDGLLEFCGGDFNFHIENNRAYFDCKEQTVAVAYSPYGQDSWTELAVDEIPELYRMPGFGYFYRGSLESVNRESSNGWYDLKVTLTDASGNMQEQTISPAFRIANTTGVSETLQGTMNLRHEGGQIYVTGTEKAGLTIYSVDGTCVMKVADAVSRPVSTSDIKPGMYVVKATSADGNQIVKKITVR